MFFAVLVSLLAAGDLLLDGQKAFQAGDLSAAEQAFRAYLKLNPSSAEAMSNLAAVFARREQYADAIGLYQKALQSSPKLVQVRFNLGVAQMKSGDYTGCSQSFDQFLHSYPKETRAIQLLGLCRIEAGDLKGGISALEQVPPDPGVLYALAYAQARNGDDAKAGELLSRLESQPAQARLVEGLIEYRREHYPEARQKFEEALKHDANLAPALAAMGRLALHENQDDEAISYLEKALRLSAQDAESTYQLGVLYDRNNRSPEGRKLLEKALALRSNYADPHYQLARIDFREKKYSEALKHLQIAAKLLPNQEAIRLLLARTYQAVGRPQDAQREYAEVRRIKQQVVERDQLQILK